MERAEEEHRRIGEKQKWASQALAQGSGTGSRPPPHRGQLQQLEEEEVSRGKPRNREEQHWAKKEEEEAERARKGQEEALAARQPDLQQRHQSSLAHKLHGSNSLPRQTHQDTDRRHLVSSLSSSSLLPLSSFSSEEVEWVPRKEEGRTRKDEEDRLRRVEEQGAASKAQDDTHQQQPNHFESIPLEACATDETAAATHTHTLPQAAGAEVQVPQINLPHASLPQILLNSHTLTGGKGQVGKGGQGGGERGVLVGRKDMQGHIDTEVFVARHMHACIDLPLQDMSPQDHQDMLQDMPQPQHMLQDMPQPQHKTAMPLPAPTASYCLHLPAAEAPLSQAVVPEAGSSLCCYTCALVFVPPCRHFLVGSCRHGPRSPPLSLSLHTCDLCVYVLARVCARG